MYFEPRIHDALRLRAAQMDRSVSELVNDAVRHSLLEDADDLRAFAERRDEPDLDFETVVTGLRQRGAL